jgi:hypothetical protein
MNTKKSQACPNRVAAITAMTNWLDSCSQMLGDRTFFSFVLTWAALGLCGCASDETAGRFLVQPDRYILYNCDALATTAQGTAARQRELEALMTKAGADTSGRLVSSMTYRPEYLQLRGQMDQLRKTAAEKNCNLSASGARSSDQLRR